MLARLLAGRRWTVLVGTGIVAAAIAVTAVLAQPAPADCVPHPAALPASSPLGRPSPRHPNIIFILTDDQAYNELWPMRNVRRLLVDHGVTFRNFFVTTSDCCPSRASILTGLYSRHTGVYADGGPLGGAPRFNDTSTIATWLQGAGYTTALVGKYLNEYALLGQHYIPPGWNEWDAIGGMQPALHYYDYQLNENGTLVSCGAQPQDYSTTVLASRAVGFIHRVHGPFFLYIGTNAPHLPAVPAPGNGGAFPHLRPFRPPGFNQRNVSAEPWGNEVPLLTPAQIAHIDHYRRRMLQSLLGVDRLVGRVVAAVRAKGQLNDTIIALSSDNGFMFGQHRLQGKVWPFEPSIRVPLVVRVPWYTRPHVDTHLALNIDLAPTFAGLAGVKPGLKEDGRSLVPLLHGRNVPWRTAFVEEFLGTGNMRVQTPPPFEAIRTERYMYVEYRNGWRELYDLRTDPYELHNLAGEPSQAGLEAHLGARLQRLLRT